MGGDLSYQEKLEWKIWDGIRAVLWRLSGLILYTQDVYDQRVPGLIPMYNEAKSILGETSSSICI